MTRGWPAAAGQGAWLVGVDLRSTQKGRPRADFYRSRPAVESSARGRPRGGVDRSRPVVDSARSPQGRLLSESTCGRLSEVAPGPASIGVDLRSSQRGVALGPALIGVDLHHTATVLLRTLLPSQKYAYIRPYCTCRRIRPKIRKRMDGDRHSNYFILSPIISG